MNPIGKSVSSLLGLAIAVAVSAGGVSAADSSAVTAAPAKQAAMKSSKPRPAGPVTRTVTFSVPSISCPVCEGKIRGALKGYPGLGPILVDVDKKTTRIVVTDTTVNTDDIILKVRDAGYVSEVVSEVSIYRIDYKRGAVEWQSIQGALKAVPGVRMVAVSVASPDAGRKFLFFAIEAEVGRAGPDDFEAVLAAHGYPYKKIY